MKKYHQLVLFIVSVISFSLLLVYRHEYNRLHYILQVFNFFGQPCNLTDLQLPENLISEPDWGVKGSWLENEDIYLYSGFWTSKQEANVIVLQTNPAQTPRNCFLWFEDKAQPVLGKFKYAQIAYDNILKHGAFSFYCSLINTEHVPYAVSFTAKKSRFEHLKKVFLTYVKNHKPKTNITICISPSTFNKALLIEFLSYHKLIGIDSFIFYCEIPHRLSKILTNLSNRLGIKLVFMDWNYPKTEGIITRNIVETDCKLRFSGISKNVITLESDEFIVPEKYYALNQVLHDYDSKYLSAKVTLPVQSFCIENVKPHVPIITQNTEVIYDNKNLIRQIFRTDSSENILINQAIIKGTIVVHKYVSCKSGEKHRSYPDNSLKRFTTDLTRSTLMQLSIHKQI